MHREGDGIALAQRNHLRPRLHAGPLFRQNELPAGEILSRLREKERHLYGKHMLSVQVLVKTIEVACLVLQQ